MRGTAQQAEGTACVKAQKAGRAWLELPRPRRVGWGVARGRADNTEYCGRKETFMGTLDGGAGREASHREEEWAAMEQEGDARPWAGLFSSLNLSLLICKVGSLNQSLEDLCPAVC